MRKYIAIALLGLFFACNIKKSNDTLYQRTNVPALFNKLRPCSVEGSADSILCGTYTVYENQQTKKGRTIDLNIMVIPALERGSIQMPIFCLDGGPGVAATNAVSFYAMRDNPYRQNHDVVLIDVRGTGKSGPLHCKSLEFKAGLQDQFAEMYPGDAVKQCYDSLSRQADLTQYTTTNIATDLNEVRQWLGYDKIHLLGLSYGTRLALEYMRRFPDAVQSTVLWSATSTNTRMPLYHAVFAQQTLEKIFDDCNKDSLCNSNFSQLEEEFNSLMRKGRKAGFIVPNRSGEGKETPLTISWDAFQTKIRSMMYMPFSMRQIPYIIHESYLGNWKPFISLFPEGPDSGDFIAEGLYLCITCSEDVPFITAEETSSLTKGTFMGTYRIDQQQAACANWGRGDIPKDFLEPVKSTVPVLILTGSYDPVTPVSMAKDIAQYLPNSQVVEIPEMSHTFDGLSNEDCFDNLIVTFVNQSGKSILNSECVLTMKPTPYKIKE